MKESLNRLWRLKFQVAKLKFQVTLFHKIHFLTLMPPPQKTLCTLGMPTSVPAKVTVYTRNAYLRPRQSHCVH